MFCTSALLLLWLWSTHVGQNTMQTWNKAWTLPVKPKHSNIVLAQWKNNILYLQVKYTFQVRVFYWQLHCLLLPLQTPGSMLLFYNGFFSFYLMDTASRNIDTTAPSSGNGRQHLVLCQNFFSFNQPLSVTITLAAFTLESLRYNVISGYSYFSGWRGFFPLLSFFFHHSHPTPPVFFWKRICTHWIIISLTKLLSVLMSRKSCRKQRRRELLCHSFGLGSACPHSTSVQLVHL